jgi:hypothetical protein
MVRTFTPIGVGCGSVDQQGLYPWPPSYPKPFGFYDQTGLTSTYGEYYNMTYYPPNYHDKIVAGKTQVVEVP